MIAELDAPDRPLPQRPRLFALTTWSEQAPDPESRVTLDDDRDALGMPRVCLDWRLGGINTPSLRCCQTVTGEHSGHREVARFKLTMTDGALSP